MDRKQAQIESDVAGPAGQAGFLLIAPPNEALEWDIQHEIASTSRQWLPERQAWWIAAPYLSTARSILSRMDVPPQRVAIAPAPAPLADAQPAKPAAPRAHVQPSLWTRLRARLRGVLAPS